jgi:cation:H+ antiporter
VDNAQPEQGPQIRTSSIGLDITGRFLMIAVGLGLLVLGSRLLVEASVALAKGLGVSDLIIGLTVVAAGTSLPEVATSVIAGLKGQRDIAVGNVIGSNLFNLLCVLGLSAAISPTGIPVSLAVVNFDLPIMIGVVIACMPIFYSGSRIGRWEGLLLLAYYVAYTADLILSSQGHAWLHSLRVVLGGFIIPLTSLFLFTVAYREWRQKGRVATAVASAD